MLKFAGASVLAAPALARAALTIEIIGGSGKEIPITVLPFGNQERHKDKVSEIILGNLLRSGLFREQSAGWMPQYPSEPEQVDWRNLRNRGVENLVIGNIVERSDGRLALRFRLMDAVKQTQRTGFSYTVPSGELRASAHKIADVIYEELTGEAGVFSTRICYVVKIKDRYHMVFCYRQSFDFRTNPQRGYRLGHAFSDDLQNWRRDDAWIEMGSGPGEWDSDMRCYPHIFSDEDKIYLLYNGNQFGRHGFGLAELVP